MPLPPTFLGRTRALLALISTLATAYLAAGTAAAADDDDDNTALPRSFELGYESIRLPAGERLGLLSGTLLFELADGWWFGPAVHGAAAGERGGFFVGGATIGRRWTLAPRWQAGLSLFVGGGGGAGAPVGGGLMVRPAATLLYDVGVVHVGASVSSVRFPSGNIGSRGLGLVLVWDGSYRYLDAARIGSAAGASSDDAGAHDAGSGLGFVDTAITLGSYRLDDGSGRSLRMVGARATRAGATGDTSFAWGLEAAAAAGGGAAGYMEILGTLALRRELAAGLQIGARAALGLGGGGDVPTGGGPIAKVAATVAWQLSPRWQIGAEAGRWAALDGRGRASTAGVWLAGRLDPLPGVPARVAGYAWSGGVQQVARARRRDGSAGRLVAFGGGLDLRLSERSYATAQVYSAFAGGAGAYSVGLLGAGVDTPTFASRWSAGAELLLGAAGGGGVATGGGGVAQAVVWTGLGFGANGRLRLGVGGVRSLRGDAGLSSPLVELMWTQSFGLRGL